jgi:hypothetical protein
VLSPPLISMIQAATLVKAYGYSIIFRHVRLFVGLNVCVAGSPDAGFGHIVHIELICFLLT